MKNKGRCRRYRVVLGLVLTASAPLSGCTVGPDYTPPDVAPVMQERWQAAELEADPAFDQEVQPVNSWWGQFHDDQLSGLIDRLSASSLALAEARQRVVEAEARRRVVGADERLQLDAALGYTRAEAGDEALSLQGPPPGATLDLFSTSLLAGWELDLWGRTARLLEAADEDIGAGFEDFRAMRLSLAAELALAYFEVRTLEARLGTVRENVRLQEQSLELARNRLTAGNGTALAVVRAERLVESTRSRLPALMRSLTAADNRIKVLLGLPPKTAVLQPGPLPEVPLLIGIGLPVDLLTRRPDIRRALHRYHGAVARIGAAEAQRYPTLTLSGTLSLSSDSLADMLGGEAVIYSLGPGLRVPLLTGGRLESVVAVRASQAEQARLALEQTIIAALAEVENAAAGVVRSQQEVADLARAEERGARSVALAEALYQSGLGDLLEVLDNQQQLVTLQEARLLAGQRALSDVVRLFRALGGGWEKDGVPGTGTAAGIMAESALPAE